MDNETAKLFEKLLYVTGIVTAFWKTVDAIFSYLKERQRGVIVDVVKEVVDDRLEAINKSLDNIKEKLYDLKK